MTHTVEYISTIFLVREKFLLTRMFRLIGENLEEFDFSVDSQYHVYVSRTGMFEELCFMARGTYAECVEQGRAFVRLQWPSTNYDAGEGYTPNIGHVATLRSNREDITGVCEVIYFKNFVTGIQ